MITLNREVNFINKDEIVPVKATSNPVRKITLVKHKKVVSLSPIDVVQNKGPSEDENEEFFTDVTWMNLEDGNNMVINLTPVLLT